MQFFKTLQNDNSKQIIVLILAIIFDVFPIVLIKNFFNIDIWPDSVMYYWMNNSGGLFINFLTMIIFLRIDAWIKNRQVAKKSKK